MQMLIMWQDLKEGSWSDIVRALVNIGKKYLAARIAKKYGKTLHTYTCAHKLHMIIFSHTGVPLPQPSNRNSIGSDAIVEVWAVHCIIFVCRVL